MTDYSSALRFLPVHGRRRNLSYSVELEDRLLALGFRAELPVYEFSDALTEEVGLAVCGSRGEVVLVTLDAGSRSPDAFVLLAVDRVSVGLEVAPTGANSRTYLLEGRFVPEAIVDCYSGNQAYASATLDVASAARRRVIAFGSALADQSIFDGVYQVLDSE